MHRGLKISTHDLIRWSVYAIILLVPLTAIAGSVWGLGANFDTPSVILPLTVLRGLTLLIVAIWGLQIFAQGELLYRRSPLNPWLMLYGIVLTLVTLASPHSWADFFGEQGELHGLITVLNFVFITGVVLNFFQKKEEVYRAIQLGVVAVLLAAAVGTANRLTVEMFLFILVGLAASYYHIRFDPTPQSRQFKKIPLVKVTKLGFTLVVLGLFLMSAWFTFRQLVADYALEQGDIARQEDNTQTMLRQYQRATQLIPWIPGLWERYGDGAHEFAQHDNPPEITRQLLETSIHAYEIADLRQGGRPTLLVKMGEAYLNYGTVLEESGHYAKAEEARVQGVTLYREAMEVGGEDPQFAYAYAKLLLEEKRYDEAAEIFTAVLVLSDPYEDTHYQLALIATELRQYDVARGHIQIALQANAGDERVKALLQRINQETK